MKLSGNTILVTGGGSGIGLALAKAFVRQGDNTVIACGRSERKLHSVRAGNPAIATFPCDLASDQDQRALVDTVTHRYPDLNILINNAGIQYNYSFTDLRSHADLIDQEVRTNFLAHATLTDRLLPVLMQRPDAAIVNVTSALAVLPKQSAPIYCATKAAMRSFTKALRYQLQSTPVKVFEIVPALVDTDMTKGRGTGKTTPEALAAEALRGIESNRYEMRIGRTRLLWALHRLLPTVAERIVRRG